MRDLSLPFVRVTETTVRRYAWNGQSVTVTVQLWSYAYLRFSNDSPLGWR